MTNPTPEQVAALVERLKPIAERAIKRPYPCTDEYSDMRKAQNEFHALMTPDLFLALSARLKEAEEAMKPFAAVGRERASLAKRARWGFDGPVVDDNDFRRAAAFLKLGEKK